MPYRFIIVIGLALLPITMAGCVNQEAFAAADYAKCQQLGFAPGTQYYNMCLSQVQQQRTAGVTKPELVPGETAAISTSGANR
jgi:hypothetical protein